MNDGRTEGSGGCVNSRRKAMSDLFKLSPTKVTMRNLSAVISGRPSGDPTHPENAGDADWQAGYLVGCHTEKESDDDIPEEWKRRGCPWDKPGWEKGAKGFRNWKAGYWAGRFAHLGEKR